MNSESERKPMIYLGLGLSVAAAVLGYGIGAGLLAEVVAEDGSAQSEADPLPAENRSLGERLAKVNARIQILMGAGTVTVGLTAAPTVIATDDAELARRLAAIKAAEANLARVKRGELTDAEMKTRVASVVGEYFEATALGDSEAALGSMKALGKLDPRAYPDLVQLWKDMESSKWMEMDRRKRRGWATKTFLHWTLTAKELKVNAKDADALQTLALQTLSFTEPDKQALATSLLAYLGRAGMPKDAPTEEEQKAQEEKFRAQMEERRAKREKARVAKGEPPRPERRRGGRGGAGSRGGGRRGAGGAAAAGSKAKPGKAKPASGAKATKGAKATGGNRPAASGGRAGRAAGAGPGGRGGFRRGGRGGRRFGGRGGFGLFGFGGGDNWRLAMGGLSRIVKPEVESFLANVLTDFNYPKDVRLAALDGLIRQEGELALEVVRNATKDTDEEIKLAAERARARMTATVSGYLITNVAKESQGEKLGLHSGAIVTKYGDKPIESRWDLQRFARSAKGKTVEITAQQDGREQTFVVKVGDRIGISGEYVTPRKRKSRSKAVPKPDTAKATPAQKEG